MLRPAIVAWYLLASIILLALPLSRRCLPPKGWRILHGLLSVGFVGLATWHVVAVGRHSNHVLSVFWIVQATAAVAVIVRRMLPAGSISPVGDREKETRDA